jgi:GNAT superfamily N-acetyltransferase
MTSDALDGMPRITAEMDDIGLTVTGPTVTSSTVTSSTVTSPTVAGPTLTSPTVAPAAAVWRVRPAVPADVAQIHGLVQDLAVHQREPDAVRATPEDLGAAFFNPHPRVYCHVLEVDAPAGPTVAGVAIWYITFSTWRGRHGLWLEDLFLRPEYRGLGAGRALLAELAEICLDRGYARLEWCVLDWNEPAQDFYRRSGAHSEDDKTVWRMTDGALTALAGSHR